jgi:guanylate kinase
MNTVHLLIGDSGCGKSTIFGELSTHGTKAELISADKCQKNWAALGRKVDEAISAGKIPILTITRGISTFIKFRPDLNFKLYFVDATAEKIAENRRIRAGDPYKEVDLDRVNTRLRRLNRIYEIYGQSGVRGSYQVILEELYKV